MTTTLNLTQYISNVIEGKSALFTDASDRIWEFAETRFDEFQSAELLMELLESEGFTIERGVAGLETGFVASYGTGLPVIALLGEYDALADLSQEAGISTYHPVQPRGNGHGCGHNLLGIGALAAAVAVKDYLVDHPETKGTIRFYGCPAEESGYGKTYLAREGYFKDVDAALSWHPHSLNAVMHGSSNAVIHGTFTFKGISAHAAAAPHLGRSALDAVELMNIGSNYMREHMIDQARIHYAITNSGGFAPNVVQAEAEVTYLVRAPKTAQVRSLFERLVKVAEGAALMTETAMEFKYEGACANLIPNSTLEKVMHQHLVAFGAPEYEEEEYSYAKAIYDTLPLQNQQEAGALVGPELAPLLAERPLPNFIAPYSDEKETFMGGSTDVADVSWNVPTAQCITSTMAFGTPLHAWQTVAQGKSTYAHKGMLLAAKTMAATAIESILHPEIVKEAKQELQDRLGGEVYDCLVPADVHPPQRGE
ncbi:MULTISPECIES: M20 family metallopeptidase [Paenibacillus]|uniref:Aminobenzoyl-glutamate utilization protein B n=1 Tax=Paenibacillus pabuli TaxID=1472 RepID=A0A855XYR3_9BACL|nr:MULTISPECIES: M20 family metallopeptidase [Paenibacillus]PWW43472.1 aminobenzoyl-glutamate utilization protein B [Paenibacillus pabuli]PXW09379.1 aminobenzoyl-glutamate utilization protein B [Paenibacillus taichungensis]